VVVTEGAQISNVQSGLETCQSEKKKMVSMTWHCTVCR